MIPWVVATVATGLALLAAERAKAGTTRVKKIAVREARRGARARTRADRAETRTQREVTTEREAGKRRRRKRKKAAPIPDHQVRITAKDATPAETAPRIRPKKYAQQLYVYATRTIKAGKARTLGSKAKPNEEIKRLQGGMRRLRKDGIYGPKTRARGKQLLGKSFPVRRSVKAASRSYMPTRTATARALPPPPPPPPRSPPPAEPEPVEVVEDIEEEEEEEVEVVARGAKRAALDLLLYARGIGRSGRAAAFGYKGHPNQMVEDAQRDMGGLVADGMYGPNTRARGRELTGQRFPAR